MRDRVRRRGGSPQQVDLVAGSRRKKLNGDENRRFGNVAERGGDESRDLSRRSGGVKFDGGEHDSNRSEIGDEEFDGIREQ